MLADFLPEEPVQTMSIGVAVSHLADPRMIIEIEVEAYAGNKRKD